MVRKTIETEKNNPASVRPAVRHIGSTHRLIIRTNKSDPFPIDSPEIPAVSLALYANLLMRLSPLQVGAVAMGPGRIARLTYRPVEFIMAAFLLAADFRGPDSLRMRPARDASCR